MQKWEINKTYHLVEYAGFIASDPDSNGKIYRKIYYNTFKVIDTDSAGRVVQIAINDDYFTANVLELTFIFRDEDLQYFKLVDNLPEIKAYSPDEVVIAWLDKLQYVYNSSDNIHTFDYADMTLGFSNAPYIQGSKSVVEFINKKYDELKDIKSTQKQLQSKREELLAELAEIDKQLGGK